MGTWPSPTTLTSVIVGFSASGRASAG